MSSLLVGIEHVDRSDPFPEPVLIACPVPGLRNAKPVLAQDNHGNRQAFGPRDNFEGQRFSFCGGRQGIRVENQRHISGSILSECSSVSRWIRSVSFRRCFSLPMCFTPGFFCALALAASLSLTASVTNSRSGIPRCAAIDLARRKMVSGISN